MFHFGGATTDTSGQPYTMTMESAKLRMTAVNPSLLPGGPVEPTPAIPTPYVEKTPPPASAPAPANPDTAQRDKERTEHADRAIAAANRQLDDAAAFIKEQAGSP